MSHEAEASQSPLPCELPYAVEADDGFRFLDSESSVLTAYLPCPLQLTLFSCLSPECYQVAVSSPGLILLNCVRLRVFTLGPCLTQDVSVEFPSE